MKHIVPISIVFNLTVDADEESEALAEAEVLMEKMDLSKLPDDHIIQYGESSLLTNEDEDNESFVNNYKAQMTASDDNEDD